MDPEPPVRRDPFLVALPVAPDEPVIVLEANALRHSRLGERFVACLADRDPDLFAGIERETGIDVLKDVDRVAVVGEAVVISGFFDRARLDRLVTEEEATLEPYGEAGRIWSPAPGRGDPVVGAWRDQLLVLADDAAQVRQALDQLEGRTPVPDAGIPEELAYGELYGVVPGALARRLLPRSERELADRVAAAASRIELHVDAMEDVAGVVRVRGEDETAMEDLARALGAALALGRVQAQATGDGRLSDLLEQAGVVRRPGAFEVQVALPADRLERWFGDCGAR